MLSSFYFVLFCLYIKKYVTPSTNQNFIYKKKERNAVGRPCPTNGLIANSKQVIEGQGRRQKKTWKNKNEIARGSQ